MIRVTDESDGELLNRGYSYWPQSYALDDDSALCFVGRRDDRPAFFRVNRATQSVERLGPLVPYSGTGEGWYFDAAGRVSLCDGPRLRRVNPLTGDDEIVFDISPTFSDSRIWQAHSSDDGRTHSATVQGITSDGPYKNLGTIVVRDGQQTFFEAHGVLDESQVTSDGAFVLIKEDNDNRIIRLSDHAEGILGDWNRALGHSDCGPSCAIGEADKPDPGACIYLDFETLAHRVLFETTNMGHVSVRAGRCLLSGPTDLSLVALDGSGLTPLLAHGMVGSGYDFQCMANLSPCGQIAAWVSNAAGRMDLYLAWI